MQDLKINSVILANEWPDNLPFRISMFDGSWIQDCLATISKGRLLLFDYCSASTADISLAPWREWLRTYRDQSRGTHYLSDPGSQDITTQVMLDQLPAGFIASTQADFLKQWGINELVSEGTDYWESMKNAPDVAAMKMRSRSIETLILSNNDGLGTFCALTNDLHTNY